MVQAGRGCRPLHCLFLHNVHMPWTSKARYTLATKLNSTRSTLLKVDKIDRVAFSRYTLATKSTATSCRIHVVADLLPVSATVDFRQSRRCWIQLCRQCVPGFSGRRPFAVTDVLSINVRYGRRLLSLALAYRKSCGWPRTSASSGTRRSMMCRVLLPDKSANWLIDSDFVRAWRWRREGWFAR